MTPSAGMAGVVQNDTRVGDAPDQGMHQVGQCFAIPEPDDAGYHEKRSISTGFFGIWRISMANEGTIRVLVAKPGLDGHDRGAKVIARALRDAGMEVIYTGLRQTPEMVVNAALQEDVDVIGLSILSGAHNAIVPRVAELMKEQKMDDVLVLVGGIIPDQDIPGLKAVGVKGIFQPGTPMDDIVQFIRENVKPRGVPA